MGRGNRPRSTSRHQPDVGVGLTSLLQLRITVGALAVLALAGSAFATGRVTASCPAVGSSTTTTPAIRTSPTPLVAAHTQRTEQGAADAAAAFAKVLFGPLVSDPSAYRAAIAGIAADGVRTDLVARGDRALSELQRTYGFGAANVQRVVLRTVPLSWHIESDDGTVVRVRIWACGLIAVDDSHEPTVIWSTGDYDVSWTTDGWRLLDDQSVATFVPRSPQTPTGSTTLPAELATFTEYADATTH